MQIVNTKSLSPLLAILIGFLLFSSSSFFAATQAGNIPVSKPNRSIKQIAATSVKTGPDETLGQKNEIDRLIENIVSNQTAKKKRTEKPDKILGIERSKSEQNEEEITEIPIMTPSSYFTNLIMKKNPLQNNYETYIWPTYSHRISSDFGVRSDPFIPSKKTFHKGLDISGNLGDKVFAVKSGVVCYAGIQRDYGNIVIIKHPDNYYSLYAHNSVLLVHVGQKVAQGDVISKIGKTGRVTGPHLHFEIRKYAVQMNPMGFYPKLIARRN